MSDIDALLEQARSRRNQLTPAGGRLSTQDFESPLPNDVISEGKAALNDATKPVSLADRQEDVASEQSGMRLVATTNDGGRVMEDAQGNVSFVSPNYSTTDPKRIAQILEGATPAETSRSGMNQDIIDQNPGKARAIKVVEGVPFVGSYADEAIGAVYGEDAARGVRATSQAMEEERPGESLALNMAGAVTGGAAMTAAALPTAAAAAPAGPATRALYAGSVGAAAGATEGAIYGAGRAEEEGRTANAVEGGLWGGGLGLGLGAAGSAAADGIRNIARRVKGLDTSVIAQELDISNDAAKSLKRALAVEDMASARRILNSMGDEAMLADAGPATAAMLDASAQTGGAALRVTRDAVEGRATRMNDKMKTALDLAFGAPTGRREANKAITQGSAALRSQAYEKAFSQPIDYAADAGRSIEGVLERVPPRTLNAAIQEANEAMQEAGTRNMQIMAEIADDGGVTFREMPNVQQVHEIKVALQSIAQRETDPVTGIISAAGRRASRLSSQLRDALSEAVPSYKTANRLGADTFEAREALSIGERLFRPGTTVEDVQEFVARSGAGGKEALKQGIRNNIEASLSEVRRTITDPNVDARQSMQLVKALSSDANREKLILAVGEAKANRVFQQLEQTATALELKGTVARNSATAARQAMQQDIRDVAAPGAIATLAQGRPIEAGQRVVQVLTGATDEAIAGREKAIFDEIAGALTKRRGADAERALKLVEQAMSGQPIRDEEAQFVARLISAPSAQTADAYGREQLAR